MDVPPQLHDYSAIRHFNPWVEACVARASSTTNPPTRIVQLQHDLASLPLWFEQMNTSTGTVLVPKPQQSQKSRQSRPSFLEYLSSLPLPIPTPLFIVYDRTKLPVPLPTSCKNLRLQPWGWSPHTADLYSRLTTSSSVWFDGAASQTTLFGKHWACALLQSVLLQSTPAPLEPNSLLPQDAQSAAYQSGFACTTLPQVCDAIEALTAAHPASSLGIVIKDAFEGSGRGFIHVKRWALQNDATGVPREQRLLRPEQLNAIKKILRRSTPVVVERWLNLVTEFSAHYSVTSTATFTTVLFRGLLRFSANSLGKWLGSHARDPCQNMDPRTREALFGDAGEVCDAGTPLPKLSKEIRDVYERVRVALEEGLRGTMYCGPLSVDALMYETEEPEPRLMIKCVSEINLRENMGTLVLHLAQYVHPERTGLYTILSRSYLKDLDGTDFSFVDEYALVVEDGKIVEGILRLTEEGEEFMAVLVVAGTVEEARKIAKVEGGEKVPVAPAPVSLSLSETKAKRKFVWFSDRLKIASGSAQVITFTPEVLASIEVELAKVRAGRAEAQKRTYGADIQAQLDSDEWRELRQETVREFDGVSHKMLEAFREVLNIKGGVELDELHTLFHGDQGSKIDRREKTLMLGGLRDAEKRQTFLDAYEKLILEVLVPMVAEKIGCSRVVFQSFPCVRVLRPNEFSIGPHCDAQYQLPDGNLNVYLPLTDLVDTNSLYLESQPGKEDFHPLKMEYGELCTFWGCYCTHFAVENLTDKTRVSLDFRVIPGGMYEKDVEKQEVDFKVGSYYSECRKNGEGGGWAVTTRGFPSHRHGFPHTNK